tara:strand:- start:81 stop:956 length:876 start_codon:yes stop_codon:yes gene_type:complete
MTKDEYLLKNFKKIKHKEWELFVITRILHLIDDPNIEYVCQQYINTGNKHYLTDLCFPSLELYYEIDEPQHGEEEHIDKDKIRQREILEATDWKEKRIEVYNKKTKSLKSLNEVIKIVDKEIAYIKNRKKEKEKESGKKIIWDFENKFNPEKYLKNGSIDVKENVVFKNHKACLELFGYKGGHWYRAWWEIKDLNQAVWFPKLYPNKMWRNKISKDSLTITEEKIVNGKPQKREMPGNQERIVFAHYKNIFGQTVYKFYGKFVPDWSKTNEYVNVFKRTKNGTYINLSDYT